MWATITAHRRPVSYTHLDVYKRQAKKVSYDEAKETVLKALAPLGEDYVATVKEGFENRWIDVYENEGKRSGAYSVSYTHLLSQCDGGRNTRADPGARHLR